MRRSIRQLILLLPLSLLLLPGCGGSGSGNGSGLSSSPSISTVTPSGLTATLSENTETVSLGGSITYTLTLTNKTLQAVSGNLLVSCGSNARLGSVVVTNAQGQLVSPLVVCGSAFSMNITLAPGQSSSGTMSFGNIFSIPGQYKATSQIAFSPNTTPSTNYSFTQVGPLVVTAK